LFCQHHYWNGLALIVVGRLCDLLDGWVAETTHTKSPLGEVLDASADKLSTLAAVIAGFISHVAAWWLLALLLLPQVIITALSAFAYFRHTALHPSRLGKVSMAATWACFAAFYCIRAGSLPHSAVLATAGLTLLTTALGLYVAVRYATGKD
jgi:phosphatidylglycerophosphate synthase